MSSPKKTVPTPTPTRDDRLDFLVRADVAAILADVGNAVTALAQPLAVEWVAERHAELSTETLDRLIDAVDALAAAMWDRHDALRGGEAR